MMINWEREKKTRKEKERQNPKVAEEAVFGIFWQWVFACVYSDLRHRWIWHFFLLMTFCSLISCFRIFLLSKLLYKIYLFIDIINRIRLVVMNLINIRIINVTQKSSAKIRTVFMKTKNQLSQWSTFIFIEMLSGRFICRDLYSNEQTVQLIKNILKENKGAKIVSFYE